MTVFIHGTFSKKDMNMWIPFKVSSESMKSKNETWCKSFLFTIHLIECVENSDFSSFKHPRSERDDRAGISAADERIQCKVYDS